MPGPNALVAGDLTSKGFRRRSHGSTVLIRSRRISEWLVNDVAAVADEVPEKHDPVIRPLTRLCGLRQVTRKGNPIACLNLAYLFPAGAGQQPVLERRAERSTAGELYLEHRPAADLPHLVGSRAHQALAFIDRPDLGSLPHELGDRHATPVSEVDQRVSWHTLPKVRHYGALMLPLLDAAVQLR